MRMLNNNCNLEVYFLVGSKMGTPTVVHRITGSGVGAVALLDSQLFVTCHNFPQVSVYDKTTLELKRQLSIPGLGAALRGLATCTVNNSLYVSDRHNICVHKVDVTSSNVVAKWNVANKPRGLSVNKACNVLVACRESMKVQE